MRFDRGRKKLHQEAIQASSRKFRGSPKKCFYFPDAAIAFVVVVVVVRELEELQEDLGKLKEGQRCAGASSTGMLRREATAEQPSS